MRTCNCGPYISAESGGVLVPMLATVRCESTSSRNSDEPCCLRAKKKMKTKIPSGGGGGRETPRDGGLLSRRPLRVKHPTSFEPETKSGSKKTKSAWYFTG